MPNLPGVMLRASFRVMALLLLVRFAVPDEAPLVDGASRSPEKFLSATFNDGRGDSSDTKRHRGPRQSYRSHPDEERRRERVSS